MMKHVRFELLTAVDYYPCNSERAFADLYGVTTQKYFDFTFCFYAVIVQRRLLFFIDTTCFGLTGHLRVY
jgi:hypothetical protein